MAASHFLTGTHHCAIFDGKEHGATHRQFNECTLHPGHDKFMTVDEFLNKKQSESGLENDGKMSNVRNLIDRTVRVAVHYTSVDRPDTFINSENPYPCTGMKGSRYIRYGTGFLDGFCNVCDDDNNNDNGNVDDHDDNGNDDNDDVKEPCPCPDCETSTCQTPNRKSYHFIIRTATHVIFDKHEAQRAKFEFFYDYEDISNVVVLYGITVLDTPHLRLQTDCCHVVCMTHDDSLAEKLGQLCEGGDYVLVPNVLVSHPHGVSKRITVGDIPDRILVAIQNKESVQLKKGTEIRFPHCHDDTSRVVQDINSLLDKRLPIVIDDVSKTFALDCDLTVSRPGGVVVETDYEDYFDEKGYKRKPRNKVWCDVSCPGTQLVTDGGKSYTFPCNNEVPEIRMEVFVKTKYFFDKNEKNNHSMFLYRRYNMASCPGSSGARIGYYGYYSLYGTLQQVHFGNCGDFNKSSLDCIHAPEGNKQEYETEHMIGTKWYEYRREYRQCLYENITEIQ